MKRPYVICHILSALDGKITEEFMGTPKAREVGEEYARIRDAFHAEAWLYGTVTTKEFTQYRRPDTFNLSGKINVFGKCMDEQRNLCNLCCSPAVCCYIGRLRCTKSGKDGSCGDRRNTGWRDADFR